MAAYEKVKNSDDDVRSSKVPKFDVEKPEHWEQVFSIHLMSRGRAHLGFQLEPKQLQAGSAAEKVKRLEEIEMWKKHRCDRPQTTSTTSA